MKPNGATALEVNTTGINVTGDISISSGDEIVGLGDIKIKPATGDDVVLTDSLGFARIKSNETSALLYHGAAAGATSEKLQTTSTGIDVTGTVEAGAFSGTGSVAVTDFIDDDTFATATATNVPTAESVKAYVDANAGGGGGGETLAQTLALGASTGGTDLAVSAGDDIVFSDTSKAIFQDEDGDPKLEIYSDGTSLNDSIIKSTNRNLYIESTGLPNSNITHTTEASHNFYTGKSSSIPQFAVNETTGVRVLASLIETASTSHGGSISARTDISAANQVIPVIDFYRPLDTSNGDTLGSLKYFGANSSGQKILLR